MKDHHDPDPDPGLNPNPNPGPNSDPNTDPKRNALQTCAIDIYTRALCTTKSNALPAQCAILRTIYRSALHHTAMPHTRHSTPW